MNECIESCRDTAPCSKWWWIGLVPDFDKDGQFDDPLEGGGPFLTSSYLGQPWITNSDYYWLKSPDVGVFNTPQTLFFTGRLAPNTPTPPDYWLNQGIYWVWIPPWVRNWDDWLSSPVPKDEGPIKVRRTGGPNDGNDMFDYPNNVFATGDAPPGSSSFNIEFCNRGVPADKPYIFEMTAPSGWKFVNSKIGGGNPPAVTWMVGNKVYAYSPSAIDDVWHSILVQKGISCTAVVLDPASAIIPVEGTRTFTASVNASGTVERVNFSSSVPATASVSAPGYDTTVAYETNVTGHAAGGPITITADVIIDGAVTCSDTSTVTVVDTNAWWQVKDADVTAGGDIASAISGLCTLPGCDRVFGRPGLGGYPGVPVVGGTASFGTGGGLVSTLGWLANTATLSKNNREYKYAWFRRLVPDDVTINPVADLSSGGILSRGYEWYEYDGSATGLDLTISALNLGARKVVLFVKGADLNIDGKINLTKGSGFFMAIVEGDINVSPTIGGGATPHLEGFFEADNSFSSGVAATQLYVRGAVAAYGGINLQRDLPDNSQTPAEVFEYGPDLIFAYPFKLRDRRIFWQEVAP